MSAVYRGLDTRLDRAVAIKVMDPRFAADTSFVERFEQEARAAARIHHANVVAVHDQGLDHSGEAERVYLVMELIDGGTLRDLLTEHGPLPVPLALAVLEPVLSALSAAHRAGLVHRDVKPENVLIGSTGAGSVVKVGDFGLVRAISGGGLTHSSVILGTVAYLSPEQVTTGAATARGDVYSAGIVLYEMLTGTVPYVGDTALSVAYRHVNDDVPAPSALVPTIPPALDDLVRRATSRDPSARPEDAAGFLAEVEKVRATLGIAAIPVPIPKHAIGDRTMPVVNKVISPDSDELALSEARTVISAPVSGPIPAANQNTVMRPRQAGPVPTGPQGTRTMLRSDLGHPSVPTPVPQHYRQPPFTGAHPVQQQPFTGGQPMQQQHFTGAQPIQRPPFTGAQPVQRPPRDPRKLLLIWGIVGVLVLALAGTATWWFSSGRWTDVPTVVGKEASVAERELQDADLTTRRTQARDNQVPAGTVIRTDPAGGGEALRGDTVTLVVSLGKPTVPNIQPGATAAEADAAIRANELTPSKDSAVDAYDEKVPAGAVLRLDPQPGSQLEIGAQVTIVLSKGPAPKPVPDLKGKTRDEAFQALQQAGFEPFDAAPEFAADVDSGKVVRTDPPANTVIAPDGSKRVGVVTSNAVTVPDLSQQLVTDAQTKLAQVGLQVQVQHVAGDVPGSRVFSQSVAPNSRVQPGTTVVLIAVP